VASTKGKNGVEDGLFEMLGNAVLAVLFEVGLLIFWDEVVSIRDGLKGSVERWNEQDRGDMRGEIVPLLPSATRSLRSRRRFGLF